MEAEVCPLHSAFGWDWRSLRSFRPQRGEVGSGLEEPKQGACQETAEAQARLTRARPGWQPRREPPRWGGLMEHLARAVKGVGGRLDVGLGEDDLRVSG